MFGLVCIALAWPRLRRQSWWRRLDNLAGRCQWEWWRNLRSPAGRAMPCIKLLPLPPPRGRHWPVGGFLQYGVCVLTSCCSLSVVRSLRCLCACLQFSAIVQKICLLLAVTGSITRLACTCPAPKGRSRACLCMCGIPSLAELAGCREHRTAVGVAAAGVDPPPSCRLLLPACSLPCLME